MRYSDIVPPEERKTLSREEYKRRYLQLYQRKRAAEHRAAAGVLSNAEWYAKYPEYKAAVTEKDTRRRFSGWKRAVSIALLTDPLGYEVARKKRNKENLTERWRNIAYGISTADYERMLASQNGRCAICGRTSAESNKTGRALHVDHCHSTGVVRALLCGQCNAGLGYFHEDISRLLMAVVYLQIHDLPAPATGPEQIRQIAPDPQEPA